MKDKIKKGIVVLLSVSTMILLCVAVGFFGKTDEDIVINRIVGIVAIASGIGSIVIGVATILSSSLDNVREYYATGDTVEMSEARRILYNYRYIKIKFGKTVGDKDFDEWIKENIDSSKMPLFVTNKSEILSAASLTTNFFQMWGLLQYKGFLPIWVFETASGYSIIKLYEAIYDIRKEKCSSNPFYGGQFKDLCVRINAKYRKAILQCRNKESDYIKETFGIKDLSANKHYNIPLK